MAHIEAPADQLELSAAALRAVVVTVTLNVDAALALTLSLAGGVQTAPVGAPVQMKVAVPLAP